MIAAVTACGTGPRSRGAVSADCHSPPGLGVAWLSLLGGPVNLRAQRLYVEPPRGGNYLMTDRIDEKETRHLTSYVESEAKVDFLNITYLRSLL